MTSFFFILSAGFLIFHADPAFSQCSGGGSYLGNNCLGVSYAGCCGAYGDVKWCENGALCSLNCKPTPVCGWRASEGIYDCGTAGSPDPSGSNPYFCKIPCGSVSEIGCCESNAILKFCSNGTLEIFDCAKNASAEKFCGWDSVKNFYNCVVSPKPGPQQYPYQCGSACVPDCLNKECGPDGCGASCGTCGGKEVCSEEFKCIIEPCKPECTNKECGSDLCGGVCGTCQPPMVCGKFFKCIPPGDESFDAFEDEIIAEQQEETAGDSATKEADSTGITICPDGMIYYYGKCVKSFESPKDTGDIKQDQSPKCEMATSGGDLKSFAFLFLLPIMFWSAETYRRSSKRGHDSAIQTTNVTTPAAIEYGAK